MTDDDLLERIRKRAFERTKRKVGVCSTELRAPASLADVQSIENAIGTQLPALVRRMYLEITNGGFGPGAGLLTLSSESEPPWSLLTMYRDFQTAGVAKELLPLWDWGGAVWSCIDMGSADCKIVTHDDVDGGTETEFDLRQWLEAWLSGRDLWKAMYEDTDAAIMNPFTRKPIKTKIRGKVIGRPWLPRGVTSES